MKSNSIQGFFRTPGICRKISSQGSLQELKTSLPPTVTLTFSLMKLNAFPLIVRMVPPARLPLLGSTLVTSENRIMMVSAELLLLLV